LSEKLLETRGQTNAESVVSFLFWIKPSIGGA
jgi:hypothetical protein